MSRRVWALLEHHFALHKEFPVRTRRAQGLVKARQMFFVLDLDEIAEDAKYVQERYFPRAPCPDLAITKVTRLRQQRVILTLCKYEHLWDECSRLLLTNCIVAYNATILSHLLAHKERSGDASGAARLIRVSPVAWQHINLYGRYEFRKAPETIDLPALIQELVQIPVQLDLAVWRREPAPSSAGRGLV